MPYRIDPDARMAVITWPAGIPVFADWVAAVEVLLSDSAWQSGFGVVSDWRQATSEPDLEFVRAFVAFLATNNARGLGRWVTVVDPSSPAIFGMGRMGEALTDNIGIEFRVVTDFAEALRWAGGD